MSLTLPWCSFRNQEGQIIKFDDLKKLSVLSQESLICFTARVHTMYTTIYFLNLKPYTFISIKFITEHVFFFLGELNIQYILPIKRVTERNRYPRRRKGSKQGMIIHDTLKTNFFGIHPPVQHLVIIFRYISVPCGLWVKTKKNIDRMVKQV